MECHLGRIDFMVRSVIYGSMDTYNRESAKGTSLCSFLNTFTDCWDVFLRNSTADNLGIELEQFFSVGIHRLETYLTMSVLSTTTGLLSVLVFLINSLCKCLFVCYLRSTYVCFYLELTKQTVNDDLQM